MGFGMKDGEKLSLEVVVGEKTGFGMKDGEVLSVEVVVGDKTSFGCKMTVMTMMKTLATLMITTCA